MEPSKIQWSLGYTLNTGNFQNIRLDCQIQDYVREGENAKQASDRIYALVEQQLVEKLNDAKEELG
jgi:methyl coenzyme M reductase subunit D